MTTFIKLFVNIILAAMFTLISIIACAQTSSSTAPDSTERGPYQVVSAEYKIPASIDPDVLGDRMTEVWGKIFLPQDQAMNQMPLVVMLHGNHSTCGTSSQPRLDTSCQYTYSGTCPDGYVTVPNHEGYNYIAENLASWGFVVASINANRGITCGGGNEDDWGLNLARGRVFLKKLKQLYKLSSTGQTPQKI
jgi:predicted dienelactone hydrolase